MDPSGAHGGLRRAVGQAGYTLIETLVVMVLLVVVIGALADGFTNASKTETEQTARADDQEAARQALERMRRDIHCASAANVSPTGDTLSLAVNPGQCLGVTTSASDTVQWCVVAKDSSLHRYGLYRTITGTCNGTQSVFQVDHVINPATGTGQPLVWSETCSASQLKGVSIDLAVNRDPVTRLGRTYELKDTIALRNDTVGAC